MTLNRKIAVWMVRNWRRLPFHCKNPSAFQSFHFGLHKGLKLCESLENRKFKGMKKIHWENIEIIHRRFNQEKDKRIGLALLGAELALNGIVYQVSNQLLGHARTKNF